MPQPARKKARSHRARKVTHSHPAIRPNAAGIDVGSAELYVAVPLDSDPEPVRKFGTFTEDLHSLADWLIACRIETVALESTGVYWIDSLRSPSGCASHSLSRASARLRSSKSSRPGGSKSAWSTPAT